MRNNAIHTSSQTDLLTFLILLVEKTGTMPWKAFKRLLEMHEIVLGYEDSQNLHRIIKVQGDPEIIQYKQAL